MRYIPCLDGDAACSALCIPGNCSFLRGLIEGDFILVSLFPSTLRFVALEEDRTPVSSRTSSTLVLHACRRGRSTRALQSSRVARCPGDPWTRSRPCDAYLHPVCLVSNHSSWCIEILVYWERVVGLGHCYVVSFLRCGHGVNCLPRVCSCGTGLRVWTVSDSVSEVDANRTVLGLTPPSQGGRLAPGGLPGAVLAGDD